VPERFRERFERQLAKPLALGEDPLLERRFLKAESFEELAAVQRGGPFERGRRARGHVALELHHVDVHVARIEAHGLAIHEEEGRLDVHCLAQRGQ
jgi:hypothetical protein